MDKKLEERVARLEKLLSCKNEAFVRRVDPNKALKFNKNDFDNVDYVTLYVDGDDIDSIETTGRGIIEVLKRLMLELQSHVNADLKGLRNSELNAWLEFGDIDDNMVYRSDLPTIYTDSNGNVTIEKTPRRGLNSVDKLCLAMFDRHCMI